jgi:hypothetical protein
MQAPAFGKQYVLVLQGWVDLWNSVSAILHIICSCKPTSRLSLPIASGKATETQDTDCV